MRFLLSLILIITSSTSLVNAQSGYFEDAYRFGRTVPTGSARIIGIGGTQFSLGGDVSNLTGNPAGLGFFRTSEVNVSLSFTDWGVDTDFLGQSRSYNTTNFSLPNISYIGANPKGVMETGAFKGGAWGISVQRIANFNTEFGYFSDIQGESSIIDFYLQDSFGIPENQIENYGLTGLAYQTYLINPITVDENGNPITNPDTYDSFVLGFPFQDENIRTEGSASQVTFGYGANFNHKLFLGGSLGIRSINYSSFKVYNEEFFEEPLINSSLRENLFINGIGVNLNLGAIFKPTDNLNLGFVFQTPTWFTMSEEYEASSFANYDNYYFEPEDITLGNEEAFSDLVISNYGLNTPLKIGGGATFFFGKNGFISADVDWVDYSQARLRSNDFNASPDNDVIRDIYTSTINYRVGGEAWINKLRIRGGYSFLGDPYSDPAGFDQSSQIISGGLGLKINSFTIDLSIANQTYNSLYRSYQVLDEAGFNYGPITEVKNNITSGVLSLGFNF
ncbi:long-subunit fatty acid transport protein [Algoriphagus boseongensis]|uniref:Long-subunit fatty acid transport protein n=1 Tax=Algoriphagus boseongensis TaxID=1442587 RepID=A0A4R6T5I5_9BACT|nr:long-chain fatty acid transporter [Algoriphagus boseongensis]TDQ18348.1 long-subunit fatty acid transport protein [Algoriphagus boseongensis]